MREIHFAVIRGVVCRVVFSLERHERRRHSHFFLFATYGDNDDDDEDDGVEGDDDSFQLKYVNR